MEVIEGKKSGARTLMHIRGRKLEVGMGSEKRKAEERADKEGATRVKPCNERASNEGDTRVRPRT